MPPASQSQTNKPWILELLAALGVHDPIVGERWIVTRCPLAYWTHSKGKDTNPSFGVHVESGSFNCFVCGGGTIGKLIQLLEMYLSRDPTPIKRFDIRRAREILATRALREEAVALPEYQEFPLLIQPLVEWPEYVLDQFVPWNHAPRAVWYLSKGRVEHDSEAVEPAIADAMELHYDAERDRIVCPYRTAWGKLAGARGRAIDPDAKLKHFDYTWNKANNSHLIWYGEQLLSKAVDAHKPIVIVEGQFDAMNVLRVYPYVVAGLTAKPPIYKVDKLRDCWDGVILMLDNDAAGDMAVQRYTQRLTKIQLGRMEYPKQYKDPASIPLKVLEELFAELV